MINIHEQFDWSVCDIQPFLWNRAMGLEALKPFLIASRGVVLSAVAARSSQVAWMASSCVPRSVCSADLLHCVAAVRLSLLTVLRHTPC